MGEATRIVWPSKGVVELESFDVGEPKETQVLVETENTLISPGTELAFLNALPNTSAAYPQHPGYNNVGRIRAVGAGVNWLEVGDRVVSPSPHASHILTGTNRVLKVPAGVEPTIAVYFNMAAIALGAVRKARIELGEVVLVLGQGLIGNLAGCREACLSSLWISSMSALPCLSGAAQMCASTPVRSSCKPASARRWVASASM